MVGAFVSACTARAAAGLFMRARNSYRRVRSERALLVHLSTINEVPATARRCRGFPPRPAPLGDRRHVPHPHQPWLHALVGGVLLPGRAKQRVLVSGPNRESAPGLRPSDPPCQPVRPEEQPSELQPLTRITYATFTLKT